MITIRVKASKINELINFCIQYNIFYSNLVFTNNYVILKIRKNDYTRLKEKYGKKNIKIIKRYGIDYIKKSFKNECIYAISILISLSFLLMLSRTIFVIDIITSNNILKNIISDELANYGIEKYKFIKTYDEIEEIKKGILNNNKDKLEWIEIKRDGTHYNVYLTERVKNEYKNENSNRNLIAKKDALILKMINEKGMPIKFVNDYVKKGEIIVSGDIYRGETLVNRVDASAIVYGEVWYKVNVTIPYKYIEYSPSSNIINHYYLQFPSFSMTLCGYYNNNNVISEKSVLIDKPYLPFKLIKERKTLYKYKEYNITAKEGISEALKRAERSILATLNDNEYIIDKKVLKYNEFSSKINVEVFFRVYENIVEYSNIL